MPDPGPGTDPSGPARSGLRNPAAAVRGVGAGTLVIEAVVLLLAVVPLIRLGGAGTGAAVAAVLVLVGCCALLAGLLRYRWAWYGGVALQLALLGAGGLLFGAGGLRIALGLLGLVFLGVWGYVLSVRRRVLGPAAERSSNWSYRLTGRGRCTNSTPRARRSSYASSTSGTSSIRCTSRRSTGGMSTTRRSTMRPSPDSSTALPGPMSSWTKPSTSR